MSSRSLIHRLTPYFATRIRHNHRLLSALPETQSSSEIPSPSQSVDAVHLTDNCVRRMKELQADEAKGKMLRLSIEAGGCSGFQYNFMLDDKSNADDRVFERDGVKLVVDKISLDFVKGATVDYVEELIRSAFQLIVTSDRLRRIMQDESPICHSHENVSTNPSAVGGCSCKSSFMVK